MAVYARQNIKYRPTTTWYASSYAQATLTVVDGDAPSGMSELEYITITSSDGTVRTYVLIDDETSGVTTGDALVGGSSDVGTGLAQ